jgi:streptomycin 6-kinase
MAGGRLIAHARDWVRPVPTGDVRIPRTLDHWRAVPGGRAWLTSLPAIVEACAEAWDLRVGAPYNGGKVGLALRAERPDGTPAVLKVNFPGSDSEHEATALAHWQGDGVVHLLEHDRAHAALLIERCDPGGQLSDVADEDEANATAARLLARIWRPPPELHSFPLLEHEAARRAEELPLRWKALRRPFERTLLHTAVGAFTELGSSQEDPVVCHQDFHGGNVLRATREPWLAIDPKPLVGERAFDTAWLLRDRRASIVADAHPRRRMRRRLDLLAAELALDRERVRAWGVARAVAWSLDAGPVHGAHLECARLLLAA